MNPATSRIARLRRRISALQLLGIAHYSASLRLLCPVGTPKAPTVGDIRHRKRTLQPVQLRILGLTEVPKILAESRILTDYLDQPRLYCQLIKGNIVKIKMEWYPSQF